MARARVFHDCEKPFIRCFCYTQLLTIVFVNDVKKINMKTDREKLIDFANFCHREYLTDIPNYSIEKYIDSINKANDGTKTINNNEQTKEVCFNCGQKPIKYYPTELCEECYSRWRTN